MALLVSLRAAFERTGTPRFALRSGECPRTVAHTSHSLGATNVSDPAPSAVATRVAVTDEAKRALGDRPEVRIVEFPFKVGRETVLEICSLSTRLLALESDHRARAVQ